MKICHSGGAIGADMEFEAQCLLYPQKFAVRAYSFQGHNTSSTNRVILTEQDLSKADQTVMLAARMLKKNVPYKDFVRNLIRRNYYQVLNSEAVVAVGNLSLGSNLVDGGTGWAVEMAKLMNRQLCVFDQITNRCFFFDHSTSTFKMLDKFPDLKNYTNFAGIGTRELTPNGRNFIKNLITLSANL